MRMRPSRIIVGEVRQAAMARGRERRWFSLVTPVVIRAVGHAQATGAAGAPKFSDAAAWGPRIKTGYDALLHSALAGKNAMPPQGGGSFADFEIGRAVVYMANDAGAKFEEPAAPAAAASDAASEPAK